METDRQVVQEIAASVEQYYVGSVKPRGYFALYVKYSVSCLSRNERYYPFGEEDEVTHQDACNRPLQLHTKHRSCVVSAN